VRVIEPSRTLGRMNAMLRQYTSPRTHCRGTKCRAKCHRSNPCALVKFWNNGNQTEETALLPAWFMSLWPICSSITKYTIPAAHYGTRLGSLDLLSVNHCCERLRPSGVCTVHFPIFPRIRISLSLAHNRSVASAATYRHCASVRIVFPGTASVPGDKILHRAPEIIDSYSKVIGKLHFRLIDYV